MTPQAQAAFREWLDQQIAEAEADEAALRAAEPPDWPAVDMARASKAALLRVRAYFTGEQ
jgi:hypothetical protein